MQAWLQRLGKKKGDASGGNATGSTSPLRRGSLGGFLGEGNRGGSDSYVGGTGGGGGGNTNSGGGATAASVGEELIKGQLITRVCEQLVREIQRILRSAKEQQNLYGGTRWAGTDDLLALLSDPSSSSSKDGPDLTSPAVSDDRSSEHEEGGDSHNLLGTLEELMGHPQFVSRCLEAALPPNLGHCLRLMRVIELEAAAPQPIVDDGAMDVDGDEADGNKGGEIKRGIAVTVDATARIARVLIKLCQENAVVEQLRHHLEGLFKLTTASYPLTGVHIQAAACEIVTAISIRSLSSSLVWFIHDRQIVMQMMDDMIELCKMNVEVDEEANEIEVAAGGGEGGNSAARGRVDSLSDFLLAGARAEEANMWLTAAKAVITLVCNSCRYSAALVSDLQEARGYEIFKHMVHNSSAERRPELLSRLSALVGAGTDNAADRHAAGDEMTLGQSARNVAAFELLRDVLVESTPILSEMRKGDEGGNETGIARTDSQTIPLDLANISREAIVFLRRPGPKNTPEDLDREQLQLQILSAVLQVYSNHPRNYSILEPKFQVLSLYLASLSSFRSNDLKVMVIKTLEYVCSGVANCVPTHALYAASYTFMACCETFLTNPSRDTPEKAAIVRELEENVEMVCATLEKLIQFDHQFVEILCTTGVLGEVFYPLLLKAVQAYDHQVSSSSPAATNNKKSADAAEEEEKIPNAAAIMARSAPSGIDEVICLACRVLTTMLHETPLSSSRFFRTVRLHQVLYTIIGELDLRSTVAALKVLQLAALADNVGLQDDLTCLIELLQSCRNERWRQLVVLKVIKDILTSNATANDLWRSFCGFEAAVAALSSLDGAFHHQQSVAEASTTSSSALLEKSTTPMIDEEQVSSSNDGSSSIATAESGSAEVALRLGKDLEESHHLTSILNSENDQKICLELIKQIIRTITIAVSGKVLGNLRARVENRQYLKNEIGYDTLKCCLLNSKVLTRERYAREMVECIFMMVTEEQSLKYDKATIKNADAVLLLFSLLTELPRTVAMYILQKMLQLIANSTYVATEQLCLAGALRQVVAQFCDILNDPDDPLYSHLLRLLCLSGRHRVTVPDVISMLRCLAKPLFYNKDGYILLCSSFRRQVALHPELAERKRAALEEQWKSLLILAELAETSDSAPFLRLGGGKGDLLSLARKWSREEPKEIGIMDFDSVYAATAYSEGMRFVMVPTVGGAPMSSTSSTGFSFSCWFRFGIEETDYVISSLDKEEKPTPVMDNESDGAEGDIIQQILWLLTVSSTSGKSSLQVYLDLTHQQLCVESYVGKGLDTELIPVDLEPGQWHHFLLVHRRARNLLSNKNTLSVFIDGVELVESFKTDHTSFLESQTSRCFIGVPLPDTLKVNESVLRGAVAPIWHMGPILLTSEALPLPQAASAIFAAGPAYLGSFQGERPVHSNGHAIITSLFGRLHRMSLEIQSALVARGLQELMRIDQRSRDDDVWLALLTLRIPLEQIVFSFHAGYASPCEITPRNLSGGPGQNLDIYHEPCYRLVNTISHMSEEARSQWGVVFGDGVLMNPLSISDSIFGISGPQVLFPLLEVADSPSALCVVLELVRVFCKAHTASLDYMQVTGYRVMVFLLARKKHLFTPDVLRACFGLAVDVKGKQNPYHDGTSKLSPVAASSKNRPTSSASTSAGGGEGPSHYHGALSFEESTSNVLVDAAALKHLVLNWELWGGNQSRDIFVLLLSLINQVLTPKNPNAIFNAHRLHNLGMIRWTLSVMMQAAKLSTAGQAGWGLPRMTLEDSHWARCIAAPDALLSQCAELLQRLLLCRMSENDVSDIACVLLSTIAQRPKDGSWRGDLSSQNSSHGRSIHMNMSAMGTSKDVVISPQSVVRISLLEILIKVLNREHDRSRKTSGGAQGVVKKVMDFFTIETEKLGVKGTGASFLSSLPSAGSGASMQQDERQQVLKALSKSLSPEWFHSMLGSSRDSLSVSLTLRALFILLQEREESIAAFAEQDAGFSILLSTIPRHSASPIVLLPVFAMIMGMPMNQVPILPDLNASRIYQALENIPEVQQRLPRSLFGALMSALMESLSRNMNLPPPQEGKDGDHEVTLRSQYCIEEVLTSLKNALEASHSFLEICKCKEFVCPVVLALFSCADVMETQLGFEQTSRMRSSGGQQISLNTMVEEDYIRDGTGTGGPEATRQVSAPSTTVGGMIPPSQDGSTTTSLPPATGESLPNKPAYYTGPEASKLMEILTLVLKDSISSPTMPGPMGGAWSAPALVKEIFQGFPHTALELQIYTFQEAILDILSDLIKEALASGDAIPVGNIVAISAILFENAQSGLFPPTLLNAALELSLKIAREISGTRINKSLGNDLQQLLLADAISIGQAFSIVALRRCITHDEKEADKQLTMISSHLHLLLAHTKRPITANTPGLSSTRQNQPLGWRKAFASTLSGSIDGGTGSGGEEGSLASTPIDLSKSMGNLLLRPENMMKGDILQQFGPDKDEPFVACLLGEMQTFLMNEKSDSRRTSSRISEVLLKQRQTVMNELLAPELRDRKSKEKKVVDMYSKGFSLLQEGGGSPSSGLVGDDEAGANLKYRRFEHWILGSEVAEDVQQVFRNIQERAFTIFPDDQISTPEVLSQMQQAKVATYSAQSLQSSASRHSRSDHVNVRKAFENFITFHNHIIRAGLSDIANGSVHWKKCLRSLRGVASVWEGTDLYDEQEDKWAMSQADVKDAVRSMHENLRWKLDMTEGPERMKRRLKRNFEFEEVFNVMERLPAGVAAALASSSSSDALLLLPEAMTPTEGGSSVVSARPHDEDFDLRATAKLIKQVALVRKNSGIHARDSNDEDEFMFDDDEEEEALALGHGEEGDSPVTSIDITEDLTGDGEIDPTKSPLTTAFKEMKKSKSGLGDSGRSVKSVGSNSSGGGGGERGRSCSSASRGSDLRREVSRESSGGLDSSVATFDERTDSVQSPFDQRVREIDIQNMTEEEVPITSSSMQLDAGSSREGEGRGVASGNDVDMSTSLTSSGNPLHRVASMDMACTSGSLALLALEAASESKDLISNELITGFVDDSDGAILRIYNVQRCTGLEVRPALFLFCRHAIVIADGFAKLDSGEAPSSGSSIKRVPLATPTKEQQGNGSGDSNGGDRGGSSSSSTTGGGGSLSQRFNVYLRDPKDDENGVGEFHSDAVRVNRERSGGGGAATTSPSGGDSSSAEDPSQQQQTPIEMIGFDLESPPHVEKMRFDRLRILYKRRYQFRHVAVEFFDVDGRSFLVAFDTTEDQAQVVDLILDASIINSVFLSDGAKIGGTKINYKRFMQHWKQQLTNRWQSGKMTNFEYLMHLNALAGRSFHDLTQYPVFPWILSDYTSAELNLEDPSIYRDLSKPMGAIGEPRAKQFQERFEQLASLVEDLTPEEAESEAPAFHYGTHYSCAGYVLYYLIRLEPYSRLHLQLQGGKFDKSDRLFRDIKSSWDSASKENLQDVRELIPEFFYLPEFLSNHNQFDFGWLQKGLPVNHVMLPPWAKGDTREFVRIHRMALESKYVSENLGNWIDLIFGYKQTGKDAVEAQNLFVHLTYEGVVDIDAIQDTVIREATLAQIHNFGQTPSRLFKRPHPARKVPAVLQNFVVEGGGGGGGGNMPKYVDQGALVWHQYSTPSLCIVGAPQHIAMRVMSTSQIGAPYGGATPSPNQPVGDVWSIKDRAMGVGLDCALVPPNLVKYARYGSPDNGITFRVAVPTTRHQYVDRVVSVHEQLHLGPVNCMAIEENGELAVTGSKDSTVRVWSLVKQASQKTMNLQATLCGHSNEILCVDIAAQLGLLVSGGADRLAIAWDIRDFTSQRLLVGHTSPVTSASINKRTGDMVTLGGVDIRIWSITGDTLAQISAVAIVKEVPTCVVATSCPEWMNGVIAITGHDNGKLCLWGLQNLSNDSPSKAIVEGSGVGGGAGGSQQSAAAMLGQEAGGGGGSNTGMTQGRQLKVMQILQGVHGTAITAVRVGREQRDVAVGDELGRLSKWSSVSLLQLSERELIELANTRPTA